MSTARDFGSNVGFDPTATYPAIGSVSLSQGDHPYDVPPVGTRIRDNAGNEFILCDCVTPPANGWQQYEWVSFQGSTYAATRLTAAGRGFVGILMSAPTATLRYAWVQVFGWNANAWCNTSCTTATPLIVPVTTDLGTVTVATSADTNVILRGALITTDPNSCASTALSTSALAAPGGVILNYPFVDGTFNISS